MTLETNPFCSYEFIALPASRVDRYWPQVHFQCFLTMLLTCLSRLGHSPVSNGQDEQERAL